MTILYTGQPAPLDGKRKLVGSQAARRDKAMACVRSTKSTQCQGQVYVGLFFDGTGNNDKWVEDGYAQSQRARNKHSNVARLFDAHINDPASGLFRYYMPGVGTPFTEIGDTSKSLYDNLGMGFGYMGADRINYGITSIFNAVHRYLLISNLFSPSEQRALVNTVSRDAMSPLTPDGALRWAGLTAAEEKLAAIVKRHQRKVLQINVSIFGFSRGAAQARACAFWLSQICERDGGGMTLAGVPLRIGFMGLFDTVAAVGLGDVTPFTAGHMAWADRTQTIHPAVENCAHFIALHEQRASFPLEAAVGMTNVGYPGVHSDVGGGYWPGEQGKAMPEWGDSPHLSQMPLIDMHFAAIKAGVPMMSVGEITADAGLSKSFSTDARLIAAYNRWLASNGIGAGDIRAVTEANARHYLRWRGALHASGAAGVAAIDCFKRATAAKDKTDLREADEQLGLQLQWLRERRDANSTVSGYVAERLKDVLRMTTPAGRVLVSPGRDPLSAYEKKFLEIAVDGPLPPAGCAELFTDYVHDSRAGFRPLLGHHEPSLLTGGYLRFRHVFKEEIHAESVVYGWANQGLSAAKAATNAVIQFFHDLWEATVAAYASARRRVAEAMRRAALQAAATAYQFAEAQVLRKYQLAEEELFEQLRRRYR